MKALIMYLKCGLDHTFMSKSTLFWLLIFVPSFLLAKTLEVGPGKTYSSPAQAAQLAQPGDTVLIFPAIYPGGYFIEDLHGTENKIIYFLGVGMDNVIFQGNTEALHFSDVSFLHIENINVIGQTGNGINIDDGGSYDTPSHHVSIVNCRFLNLAGQGNNDFLKLSGLDDFLIDRCTFKNGATGGSGIDMVGCHRGKIKSCGFENLGSNSIQAKGGSEFIEIFQNWFKNGGQRTLNLGGSTGLAFFRPQNASFEAANIRVFTNVIIGSWAPVAFVGCINVDVYNNTLILPQNWVIRILQETVDTSRFVPCGQNSFINNLVYYNSSISRHVNIGPNTNAESFTFSHNLWYNADNPQNSAPDLPSTELAALVGKNPSFIDFVGNDFSLSKESPAIDAGTPTSCTEDYLGNPVPYGQQFDIGAFEWRDLTSGVSSAEENAPYHIYPNPFTTSLVLINKTTSEVPFYMYDGTGQQVFSQQNLRPGITIISSMPALPSGWYFCTLGEKDYLLVKQ